MKASPDRSPVTLWTEIDARVVNVSSIAAGEWYENEVRKDFTPSERMAITDAVRTEIGNRQGQRTNLVAREEATLPEEDQDEALRSKCAEVKPGQRADDLAGRTAG